MGTQRWALYPSEGVDPSLTKWEVPQVHFCPLASISRVRTQFPHKSQYRGTNGIPVRGGVSIGSSTYEAIFNFTATVRCGWCQSLTGELAQWWVYQHMSDAVDSCQPYCAPSMSAVSDSQYIRL